MTPSPCLIPKGPFSLAETLDSGQVFHFTEGHGEWVGAWDHQLLVLHQSLSGVEVRVGDPEAAAHFLALDHDLDRLYATWPTDPLSVGALAQCRGIRILRQPLWECTATFITSAQKQVAHIRAISLALRTRHGRMVGLWDAQPIHAYPSPALLATLPESELRAVGLGYRAPLLLAAARAFAEDQIDTRIILNGTKEEALAECLKIPGVGVKVANCILLFAVGRMDAIPIDVWIRRVLEQYRPQGRQRTTGAEAFLRGKFGPHAGYVQQYLYHYLRKTFGRRGAWEAFKLGHGNPRRAPSRRNRSITEPT